MNYSSIETLYKHYTNCGLVTTDTRAVVPDSIFFALKGDKFNGNEFASQALEKGASFAVVDEEKYATNEKFIYVKDVLSALQELAKYHRQQLKIPVLGITGSNGKTTTKELINAVLSQKFTTNATKGNFNNHIGVPLTLLSVNKSHEFAVVEMGANHVGEINFLCNIALPDYGIITNIGKAHLEGFGGPEGVVKAKNELYQFVKSAAGKIFVNTDNDLLMSLSGGISKITYGTSKSDYTGVLTNVSPFVELKLHDSTSVKTNLVGKYNFENILAAACIGNYFGIASEKIKYALENYIPSNNRSEVIKKGTNTILLDAYNANPTSMKAAIDNLSEMKAKNKMLILGDMLELGTASEEEHKTIVDYVINKQMGNVCFVGERFQRASAGANSTSFSTTEEAAAWLKNNIPSNTTILIKGSREKKLEKLLAAFD